MKQNRIAGTARSILVVLAFSLISCQAWAGMFDRARDLLNGPHIAHRYAELKQDFYPTSLAWSPDGKYIASTGMHTRTINIWDVEQRRIVHSMELPVPNSPSIGHVLAWSPDGRYFVSCPGSSALALRIWDARTWQVARDLTTRDGIGSCNSPVFSPDSRLLVLGGLNGVSIYSTQTWRLQKSWKFSPHDGLADVTTSSTQVALSPDGKTLAIAENGVFHRPKNIDESELWTEGHVVYWNLADDLPSRDFVAYKTEDGGSDVLSLAFSPDGRRLATSTQTGNGGAGTPKVTQSVHVWNTVDNALVGAPFDGRDFGAVHVVAYTPDGKYLIAGHLKDDGAIHLLDAQTLQIADTVHAAKHILGTAIHPDSSKFAVASGQSIVIWSLSSKK